MSHPIIVEAIEDLFVPVLVYNNRAGKDAELLKQFDEPSWNNPVVRYLNASGKDIIPRADGIWSTPGTAVRMVAALRAAGREVPKYLQAVAESQKNNVVQSATFAMHCYWEGEAKLGTVPGVHSTRSGWMGNLEVVTLTYDPEIVEYQKLVATARSFKCATKVFAHTDQQLEIARRIVGAEAVALAAEDQIRDAKASDQKYYLLQTSLRHLPLVESQAMKINAALATQQSFEQWLSPRQTKLLHRIQAVKSRDDTLLSSFRFPDQVSELAAYAAKLTAKLEQLESK